MNQYEMNWKDYYAILGVRKDAEDKDIRAAYKSMAQRFHPDKCADGDDAKMKAINEAWEVLSKSDSKSEYDRAWSQKYDTGTKSKDSGQKQSNNEFTGERDAYARSNRSGNKEQDECNTDSRRDQYKYRNSSKAQSQGPPGECKKEYVKTKQNVYYSQSKDRGKFIPWPSGHWQLVCLLAGIPLGILSALLVPILWIKIASIVLSVLAGFVTVKTKLATDSGKMGVFVRFCGATVVTLVLIVTGSVFLCIVLGYCVMRITLTIINCLLPLKGRSIRR